MRDEERDLRHEDGDDTAAVARPSGKRSARRARAASSTATIERPSPTKATTKQSGKAKKAGKDGRANPFVSLWTFLKQVVAELRKVIWPNRKQMVTYTSVVLVFVIFVIAFIGGLDVAFIKGVSWLFG
ncbi:preprotein translocase subunit SecE [Nocardia yunnanensis]|uniref:preprotein translocase subunit SecE n=1 Tax=Nocardia yunnanensis TaxID=2382165 RepID=UPI0013C43A48|nr:preprotein translocase subunit SecE [Nocardia yunnanensis]